MYSLIHYVGFLLTACSSESAESKEYTQGSAYLEEGNFAAAITALSSAVEAEPESAAVYIARGDAYIGAAEDAYSAAMEVLLSDREAVDWSEITVSLDDKSYSLQGVYENAVSDYEKAVTIIESDETTDDSTACLYKVRPTGVHSSGGETL